MSASRRDANLPVSLSSRGSVVVVMIDQRSDLDLEIAGQEVVFQQDAVLQGLVPAHDLALCLGMERSAANVLHLKISKTVSQLASNIAGAIVGQQARFGAPCPK